MRKNVDEPHANRENEVNKAPILLRNGNRQGDPGNAPRCGARTRRGTSCRAPAMPNGRCRMHGGLSTGPKTLEGIEWSRKANWKHGFYSAEEIARRRYISQLFRESRAIRARIKEDLRTGDTFGYWLHCMGIDPNQITL